MTPFVNRNEALSIASAFTGHILWRIFEVRFTTSSNSVSGMSILTVSSVAAEADSKQYQQWLLRQSQDDCFTAG
jgi:hypothetical protein